MWLLDARTRQLEYFEGTNIPPYAILSHRWEDDEVTFKDIKKGRARNKKGYRKIDLTCQQALRESHLEFKGALVAGIAYVWIDTCCIDKRSSAELSEAVNSMYQWYQDAAVCYAYLSDVKSGDMSTFEESAWFTRGWTLQELLAPVNLQFYDQHWVSIGSRAELRAAITRITDIPSVTLYLGLNAQNDKFCAASKFSWAARRQTTRVEDIAYCLLGLFQVSMPLIYGEGARAFHRLQEAILHNSADLTVFAWSTPSHGLYDNYFAPSPQYFDWADLDIHKYDGPHPSLQMSPTKLSFVTELIPTRCGIGSDLYAAPIAEVQPSVQSAYIIGLVLERFPDGYEDVSTNKIVCRIALGVKGYKLPLIELPEEVLQHRRQCRIEIYRNIPMLQFYSTSVLQEPSVDFRIRVHSKSQEYSVLAITPMSSCLDSSAHRLLLPAGHFGVAGYLSVEKREPANTHDARPLMTLLFLGCDFDFNIFCLAVRYQQDNASSEPPLISTPRLRISDICLESSADIMALVDELRKSSEDDLPLVVGDLCTDAVELHVMPSKKRLNSYPRFEITDTGIISFNLHHNQDCRDVHVDLDVPVPKNRAAKPRLVGKGIRDMRHPRNVT
jgi:hypothetical protein